MCDVLQLRIKLLVVVMCTLSFSMITVAAVYTAPCMVFVLSTPRQGGLRFLARQNNFVPIRRYRGDGLLEDSELFRGGGARVNTLTGAAAVAKQTKPINSDSLRVQVKPVVSTP